jgi:hypothetical protein
MVPTSMSIGVTGMILSSFISDMTLYTASTNLSDASRGSFSKVFILTSVIALTKTQTTTQSNLRQNATSGTSSVVLILLLRYYLGREPACTLSENGDASAVIDCKTMC